METLPIITIMGPTGVGKTELVIHLSKEVNLDIISVDSVQIYKGMHIGSGKPSREVLKNYPHKLLGFIDPWKTYSTALFVNDARKEIDYSSQSKKVPVLVGGTMLYFRSLLGGISRMPKADQNIRDEISREAEKTSWASLHKKLSSIDPDSAKRIHPNDKQRIQRALEVFMLSSRTMTEWRKRDKGDELLKSRQVLQFAVAPENRESLRKGVKKRFLSMLEAGLVEEVEGLLKLDQMDSKRISMKSVGYKQVCQYLEGEISYEEMIDKAVNATRQLAKRQMTWLKKWKDLEWLSQDMNESVKRIRTILRKKVNV
tara:strand:+ start:1427 stop:2368 length:942 start_codon:yes stop_codon:yes gene_type:complete